MADELSLYGTDLFGDPIQPKGRGVLAERFIVPPFSVLNAREGFWQTRKRAWLALGIQSEVGRDAVAYQSQETLNAIQGQTRKTNKLIPGGAGAGSCWRGSDGQSVKEREADGRAGSAKDTGINEHLTEGEQRALGAYAAFGKTTVKRGRNTATGRGDSLAFQGKAAEFDGYRAKEGTRTTTAVSGTSIFDPVLCELVYRWFCPEGGMVVDPFAGGSVRGIVAHKLGRKYWGCELRPEQVAANEEQRAAICPDTEFVTVNVSGSMLRQQFEPCAPAYIESVCRGRCCEGSKGATLITVHPSEEEHIKALGGKVVGGRLQATENGLCPFKTPEGYCGIHASGKPFGCLASPFTLNDNNTLIVRNRYRCLRCYNTENAVPAYEAHRLALVGIFGPEEADRVSDAVAGGADTVQAAMPLKRYAMLIDNDNAKHETDHPKWAAPLCWKTGDAIACLPEAPQSDLVFTCPPYGNLEQYSDDPRDLSTMEYPQFIDTLSTILLQACGGLHNNRFACIVVGDYRDKAGHYNNFVGDLVNGMKAGGLHFYNEAILVTAVGSLPIRTGKQFQAGRKLGRTHQNLLVFVKGDGKKAAKHMEAIACM